MTTMHVTESIPAYALGILSAPEQVEVARHLSGCAACQAELSAYQHVVECLPLAVPGWPLPHGLRATILNKVTASQPARAPGWNAWLQRLVQPLSPLIGIIGLLLIVALAGLNLWQWQVAQKTAHPAGEFHLVQMTATQDGAHASGLLVISDDGSFGTLVVDGLSPLDASKQYQLWLINDGKRTSGGVFSVLDSGYGMLRVESPQPLGSYPSFGITIEPAGGSPAPTGPKVLGGNL